MIVEDNTVNRKLLQTMLSGFGCSCICVTNGKEAIEVFRKNEHRFSLIFMDVHMPVLDGISATKEIKKIEKELNLDETPIIGATADCEINAIKEMKEAGMISLVFKPYSIDCIKNALKQFLQKRKKM